ncbi:MAG TPA: HD domain-containing phosphohydrolase [Azospirillum sp.]|nr:HD domain-containing phosphohydrolase [Azospirillum sp.]
MAGASDEDDLLFAAESEDEAGRGPAPAPWTVLIVDDDPEVHAITRVVLHDVEYEGRGLTFLSAFSAEEARAILRATGDVAAVLLDVVMETDDAGLKLVHFIREELGNRHVRIILRTGQPGLAPERQVIVGYDINDYKAKSELTAQTLFTATVAALRSYQHIRTIEEGRRGLENAQRATVHALGKLAEFKDEVTGDHVKRIGAWATAIAQRLRADGVYAHVVDEVFCAQIGLASMLHDVGKVGVPDHVLGKPGKLDPQEMAVMREHAAIGGRILREASGIVGGPNPLSLGAEIAESHHEKWDGTGYPYGLKGDAIPLSGRIVAVADVYDALLHRRPYKEAWDHRDVLVLIRREAGTHFDPAVVDAFLKVLEEQGAP